MSYAKRRNKKHPHLTFDDIEMFFECGACGEKEPASAASIVANSARAQSGVFTEKHAQCGEAKEAAK